MKAIALTILYAALAFGASRAIRYALLPNPAPPVIQPATWQQTFEPPTHARVRTACSYECFELCSADKRGCLGDYETQTACQHERESK